MAAYHSTHGPYEPPVFNTEPETSPAALHGPICRKPSVAKVRRLIVRASRKANR